MRLLSKSFATIRTRIRPGFDVNATVLQESALLFKLLLADGTTHVEWHTRGPAVLNNIRQGGCNFAADAAASVLIQVLQLGEISTEDRVINTFGIFEVGRILQRHVSIAGRGETRP